MSSRTWTAARAAAPPWDPPRIPTVIVVPHPDDEVLSTGGLIATQRSRGVDVSIIAVTDGEHAYPGVMDPDGLGQVRRGEQEAALRHLGVAADAITRVGAIDGSVATVEDDLLDTLSALVPADALLVAPWIHDVHPDHEACGRAAMRLAARTGQPLCMGLFWAYHQRQADVMPDGLLHCLSLDDAARTARRAAIDEHVSQVTTAMVGIPILDHDALEPVRWPEEFHVLPDGSTLASDAR